MYHDRQTPGASPMSMIIDFDGLGMSFRGSPVIHVIEVRQ